MTATEAPSASADSHVLQCMEVWGGNQATESAVTLSGLDAWVLSVPHQRSAGGGDVHYVSSCATGRINRLLVADVSGHGESVAEVASQLRDLMRRFLNHLEPSGFVRTLNREFSRISGSGRFATAVVTTFWSPTGALEICNAGHPRPLWYRAHERRWDFLEPPAPQSRGIANVPLGLLDLTRYDAWRVQLGPEDMVLLYTDSLIEAESPGRELLGETGLLERLRRLPPMPPQMLVRALHDEVRAYRGGSELDDDETLLLFRPNGRTRRLTMAEQVRSVILMLGALARSLRPGGPRMPWPDLGIENVAGFFFSRFNRRRG